MDLERVKGEVSQFIASLSDDRPFSAAQLFSDFKKAEGRGICFTKYGFPSFEAFLLQLPSIVAVDSPTGRLLKYVRSTSSDCPGPSAVNSAPKTVAQVPFTPYSQITPEMITYRLISLLEISGGEATIDALKNMYRLRFHSDFVDELRSWFNVGSFAEYEEFFRGNLSMYKVTMGGCMCKWMFRLKEWPNIGIRMNKLAGCQKIEGCLGTIDVASVSSSGNAGSSVTESEGYVKEEEGSSAGSSLSNNCQELEQNLGTQTSGFMPLWQMNEEKPGVSSRTQETVMKTELPEASTARKPHEPIVFASSIPSDESLVEVDCVSSHELETDPPQLSGRRVIVNDVKKNVPKAAKHKKLHADMCVRNVVSLLDERGGRTSLNKIRAEFRKIYGVDVIVALKDALGVRNMAEMREALKGVISLEKTGKDYTLAKPKKRTALEGRVSTPSRRHHPSILVTTVREQPYQLPQYSLEDVAMGEIVEERVCINRVYY